MGHHLVSIYIYIKGDTVFIPLLRVTIPHSKESLTVMDDNRLYPIYIYIAMSLSHEGHADNHDHIQQTDSLVVWLCNQMQM